MFAAKFANRPSFTRLRLFCPVSSFSQVRCQRAEVRQRSTSEVTSQVLDHDHDNERQIDEPLPFDQIPGPQGRYAAAVQFYRQGDGFAKFYKIPEKLFKVYGPIFKQYVTDKTPVVHIMEPADFETVYRAEGKFPSRPPLDFLVKYRKRRGEPMDLVNL